MPSFMSCNTSRCDTWRIVDVLAQPQGLGTRIIVIFQDPRSGLDCHVLKALRIEQAARHLCPSDSALGADFRILGKVEFDTSLRVQPQQQTRKNQYPKKRIAKHVWISPAEYAGTKNTAHQAEGVAP